ncbi:MAG: pyrrolysine--tRNA(Pyl) ligase large subunit [Candidatus Methanomethylophilus sp.]|nr:pyrrolysine--tRNA(Pyl) ligase large subunit [Methanomethylophilus sp.]
MAVKYTDAQVQRLREYGNVSYEAKLFESIADRDAAFSKEMSEAASANEAGIQQMIGHPARHGLTQIMSDISNALVADGFIEVRTPIIISRDALARMTITEEKPLFKQVFWLDEKRALRPMLATNLYTVMRSLRDHTKGPVKIFEVGSCFRKESHSGMHLEEFTMLNLVDMGPAGDPTETLKRYIDIVMKAAHLPDYNLVHEESDVYKETIDVDINGQEVCSAAVGPHYLDAAHDVHEPWSGAGFGIERLLTIKEKYSTVKKGGASLSYLNGCKIN